MSSAASKEGSRFWKTAAILLLLYGLLLTQGHKTKKAGVNQSRVDSNSHQLLISRR